MQLYDPQLLLPYADSDAVGKEQEGFPSHAPTLLEQMRQIGELLAFCNSGKAQGNRLEKLYVGTPASLDYNKCCSTKPKRICADVGGVLGAVAPEAASLTKLVLERCTVAAAAAGGAGVMAGLASIGRFEKLQTLELIFDQDPVVAG